jgi:hypothetical protein
MIYTQKVLKIQRFSGQTLTDGSGQPAIGTNRPASFLLPFVIDRAD